MRIDSNMGCDYMIRECKNGIVKMAEHEHEHGSMDVSSHEATFVGFVRMSVWVIAISLVTLVFLALVNS